MELHYNSKVYHSCLKQTTILEKKRIYFMMNHTKSMPNGFAGEVMDKILLQWMDTGEDCRYEDVRPFLSFVSAERREKTERYHREENKMESLFAGLMLRAALMDQTGLENEKLRFAATEEGKPYLVGREDLQFSFAHSGGAVALALHSHRIGADLEKLGDYKEAIARRFFLPEEYSYIEAAEEKEETFVWMWTRKEAYIKMTGEGLQRELHSFSVLEDAARPYQFRSFRLEDAYLSICSEHLQSAEVELRKVRAEEILRHF